MKQTKEDIKALVEMVRQANTAGWVCDSVQGCDKWEILWEKQKELTAFFDFCPFCGRELDWQNWERLKND